MKAVRKLGLVMLMAMATALSAGTTSAMATSTTSVKVASVVPSTTTAAGLSLSYPIAISFSDGEHGLLLLQGCGTSICKSWVEITADGGKHWQIRPTFVTEPAIDSSYGQGVVIKNPNRSGVDTAFLASASDGWAYGPGLFVTHDGGRQFSRVKVSAGVLGVAASAGKVWVLEQRCFLVKQKHATATECARSVLLTGPVDGMTLKPVAQQPPGFPLETGYPPGTQFPLGIVHAKSNLIVLAGVLGLDVTTDGGRTWRQIRFPCRPPYANSDWPGYAAVDPSGSLWLVCAGAPGAGFQDKQLWRSYDAGRSWLGPYQLSAVGYADTLDVVSSTTAWAYGPRAPIFHSTNGGRSWKMMLVGRFNNATGGPRGFGAIGVGDAWIVAYPTELLRTVDGGKTWSSVQLRT